VSIGTSASSPRYVVTGHKARALAEGMRALRAHSAALARGFWRGSFCVHACVRARALVVWVCAIRLCRHLGQGAGKLNADRSFLRGLDTSSRLTCRMAIRSRPSRVPPSLVRTLCLERRLLCVRTSLPGQI